MSFFIYPCCLSKRSMAPLHSKKIGRSHCLTCTFALFSPQDGQLCCMYSTDCFGNSSIVAAQNPLHNRLGRDAITKRDPPRGSAAADDTSSWKSLGRVSSPDARRRAATTSATFRVARRRLSDRTALMSGTTKANRRVRVSQRRTGGGR